MMLIVRPTANVLSMWAAAMPLPVRGATSMSFSLPDARSSTMF